MNEKTLRELTVPTFSSVNELVKYIQTLKGIEHDYGTAVYAMSMAATATFNYMASNLGVTGFQASCADLDILRRTRNINGPFVILSLDRALYPQYDLHEQVDTFIHGNIAWLRNEARALLEENESAEFKAAEEVVQHWKKLAEEG